MFVIMFYTSVIWQYSMFQDLAEKTLQVSKSLQRIVHITFKYLIWCYQSPNAKTDYI